MRKNAGNITTKSRKEVCIVPIRCRGVSPFSLVSSHLCVTEDGYSLLCAEGTGNPYRGARELSLADAGKQDAAGLVESPEMSIIPRDYPAVALR